MLYQYLKTLGLSPGALLKDVKKAYRLLAKENHPDRFMNEDEKMKQAEKMAQINEAYRHLRGYQDGPTVHVPDQPRQPKAVNAEAFLSLH